MVVEQGRWVGALPRHSSGEHALDHEAAVLVCSSSGPVFARSVRLLTLGGLWLPPDSAPETVRQRYAAYSWSMGAFTLVNVLGEAGGMLFVDAPLPVRSNNLISTLWRVLALSIWWQFRRHARALQVGHH